MNNETAKRFAHLKFGVRTDVGRRRHNNEDSHGEWPAQGVFCVADGMGGAEDGEVASRAVVESLSGLVPRWGAFDPPLSQEDRLETLARGVDAASAWVKNYADTQGKKGCGSTFVGVCFDPSDASRAVALHAGDSRVYRIRGRKIVQITRDHSVAEMAGVKDERELNPMFRSMILRAVGVKADVETERTPFDLAEGDWVLVCSDGLSRMVPDDEIARVAVAAGSPEAAASALVDKANERGGKDNVTVVAVRVGAFPKGPRPVHARLSPEERAAMLSGGDSRAADSATGTTGEAPGSVETLSTTGDTAQALSGGGARGVRTDEEVFLPEDEEDGQASTATARPAPAPKAATAEAVPVSSSADPAPAATVAKGAKKAPLVFAGAAVAVCLVAAVAMRTMSAEDTSHAESAEDESHAESAEDESHAESAEDESHAESAEDESHAESAEDNSHAESSESPEEALAMVEEESRARVAEAEAALTNAVAEVKSGLKHCLPQLDNAKATNDVGVVKAEAERLISEHRDSALEAAREAGISEETWNKARDDFDAILREVSVKAVTRLAELAKEEEERIAEAKLKSEEEEARLAEERRKAREEAEAALEKAVAEISSEFKTDWIPGIEAASSTNGVNEIREHSVAGIDDRSKTLLENAEAADVSEENMRKFNDGFAKVRESLADAAQSRLAELAAAAEQARLAEAKRKEAEVAARIAEEKRKADEARIAEEQRVTRLFGDDSMPKSLDDFNDRFSRFDAKRRLLRDNKLFPEGIGPITAARGNLKSAVDDQDEKRYESLLSDFSKSIGSKMDHKSLFSKTDSVFGRFQNAELGSCVWKFEKVLSSWEQTVEADCKTNARTCRVAFDVFRDNERPDEKRQIALFHALASFLELRAAMEPRGDTAKGKPDNQNFWEWLDSKADAMRPANGEKAE